MVERSVGGDTKEEWLTSWCVVPDLCVDLDRLFVPYKMHTHTRYTRIPRFARTTKQSWKRCTPTCLPK